MKPKTIGCIILLVFFLLFPFVSNYYMFGKFTWNPKTAMAYDYNRQVEELDCVWGIREHRGSPMCQFPPCKTYNVDELDCVREGYTDTGFLGFPNFNTEYFVCKDYGRIGFAQKLIVRN